MARKLLTLPSFSGVGAGQTATLDIPTLESYHKIVLKYQTTTAGGATQANMEAEIDEVRIKVNGKTQRVFDGRQLFDINAYHGITVIPGSAGVYGYLPIYFSEPWRRSAQGEDSLAWHMSDVDSFQIEVDINAGATAPVLATLAHREVTPLGQNNRPLPMGPIVKWRRFNWQPTGAGVFNVQTLPIIDSYYAIHMDDVTINSVDLTIDGVEWFDTVDRLDLNEMYVDQGFVPDADWTVIDFSPSARVAHARPMRDSAGVKVKDLRLDLDMAGAATFDVVTETVGLRD